MADKSRMSKVDAGVQNSHHDPGSLIILQRRRQIYLGKGYLIDKSTWIGAPPMPDFIWITFRRTTYVVEFGPDNIRVRLHLFGQTAEIVFLAWRGKEIDMAG